MIKSLDQINLEFELNYKTQNKNKNNYDHYTGAFIPPLETEIPPANIPRVSRKYVSPFMQTQRDALPINLVEHFKFGTEAGDSSGEFDNSFLASVENKSLDLKHTRMLKILFGSIMAVIIVFVIIFIFRYR